MSGITKGRELYDMPAALICPACHHLMRSEIDMATPVLFVQATCQTGTCKLYGVRHKVRLALVGAEEIKPGD